MKNNSDSSKFYEATSLPRLRVLDIVSGTSVDGPGLRTSIYFAGCHHACPGCHNPLSHNPNGGYPITVGDLLDKITVNDENVTFSGGDPLYQPVAPLIELADALHSRGYDIWCYTGFIYEDTCDNPLLRHIDVLVDGPFVESLRDTSLVFRGSSNQRIIDLNKTFNSADYRSPVLWEPDF